MAIKVETICSMLLLHLKGDSEDTEVANAATGNLEKTLDELQFDPTAADVQLLREILVNYGYDPDTRRFKHIIQDYDSLKYQLEGIKQSEAAYTAAYNGDLASLKNFLEQFPVFKDKSGGRTGQTFLYLAARHGHKEMVEWLVDVLHCDVNMQNRKEGSTPCHGAVWGASTEHRPGCQEIVEFLRKHGADATVMNDHNEAPANNALNDKVLNIFVNQATPWEYQGSDYSWYQFSAREQATIEEAFNAHKRTCRITERFLYEIDLVKFERSGRGADMDNIVSVRKLSAPVGKDVTWQFQVRDIGWKDITDEAVKAAMVKKLTSVEIPLPGGVSRKATIDFNKFTWQDIGSTRGGSIRWVPHHVKETLNTETPATELDQEDEGDETLGGLPNQEKIARPQPPPKADLREAAENILKIPVEIISKQYKRQADKAIVLRSITIDGAPLHAIVTEGSDLTIFGTAEQLKVLDTILLQKNLQEITQMVAKEEEEKPPPEPPVKIESGKYPVPALPVVQKFLLLKFSLIQDAIAKVDAAAAPKLSIDTAGDKLTLTVNGSKPQLTVAFNLCKALNILIYKYHMEQNRFNKCIQKQRGILRSRIMSVPSSASTKQDWIECGRELKQRGEEKLEVMRKAFEDKMDALLQKQLLEATPFTDNWHVPLEGVAAGEDTTAKWDAVYSTLATDALDTVLKKKVEAATESNNNNATATPFNHRAFASMKTLLDTIKQQFSGNWEELPKLLWRASLVVKSYQISTPLFLEAQPLVDKIKANQVISLTTGTGSGKSTMLPVLLVALGYKRIIVTQPRRLPCQLLSGRLTSVYGPDLAGWQVAGASETPHNPVLYVTDGLFKEWLVSGKNLKCDVIVLDEIHEKGINMDLCVGLLAKRLTSNPPNLQQKVVLSSATLDPCTLVPFGKLAASFDIPVPSPFPVKENKLVGENPVALACRLFNQKNREEQILCFLASQGEVKEAVNLFNKKTGSQAYPLFAQQNPSAQKKYLSVGSVFFSTTIAETSLTFPCLRYVIDAGVINAPFFSYTKVAGELKTIPAPRSAIKQRKGRLGRTAPGDYYQIYSDASIVSDYSTAQLCTIDLTDTEFNLVRSKVGLSLLELQKYLPCAIPPASINFARRVLLNMKVLKADGSLSESGKELSDMPVVGGVRLGCFVLSAFANKCGANALRICAILSSCGNSADPLIAAVPATFVSHQGDFQTLLNLFNAAYRDFVKATAQKFDAKAFCAKNHISYGAHILSRAMMQYEMLNQAFLQIPRFRVPSQSHVNDWKPVAQSLLTAIGDQVFGSATEYYGRKHQFIRLWSTSSTPPCTAILSSSSKVAKKFSEDPVPLVVALSIFYTPQQPNLTILSTLGVIELSWIDSVYKTIRPIPLTPSEQAKLGGNVPLPAGVTSAMNGSTLEISGPMHPAAETELAVYKKLKTTKDLSLASLCTTDQQRATLTSAMKQKFVFNPLIWRCKNTQQLTVTIDVQNQKVTAEGREVDAVDAIKGFEAFMGWLKYTQVLRSTESDVPPRALNSRDVEIEKRIARITDATRTKVDLWEQVKGPKATRTTRMEAFCWVALCSFDCRVEGGFVRDWIVGGSTATPAKPWITTVNNVPTVNKGFVPNDLDLQLPSFKQFDIDRFLKELTSIGLVIPPDCVKFDGWRYLLLVDRDEPTGPFGADLIEPHIVLTHDMVDFDVSNLYCAKDFTREIGMRVDVTEPPAELTLDSIVTNIQNKQMICLRPRDKNMATRIQKMEERGWQVVNTILYTPNKGPRFGATLTSLPSTDPAYQKIESLLKVIPNIKIHNVQLINSYNLHKLYSAQRLQIEQENGNFANERTLFHGTAASSAKAIADVGFDDRFWKFTGAFGAGAYFADDPTKSHGYTGNAPIRSMLWVKVLLGKQHSLTTFGHQITSPPVGFHSILGEVPGYKREYIVYRYGQALPYLHVTYSV